MRLPGRPRNTLPRALFVRRRFRHHRRASVIATGDTRAYLHGHRVSRDPPGPSATASWSTGVPRQMRRRDCSVVGGGGPDALEWDLDINLELELKDDQQSKLYRYLSEGHRPRYRNEPRRRAATDTLANRSVATVHLNNIL